MEKIKLSTLPLEAIVMKSGSEAIMTVADVLESLSDYIESAIYTTKPYHASFDAESILDNAIENEACDGMYEDWDDRIKSDITKEDIDEFQAILDRILARSPEANISYCEDKPIEIDM